MAKLKLGRKRRGNVTRQPDGRPSTPRGTDPKIIAARQPHRQGVALDVVHDAAAESNFGKLMLNRQITAVQYQAGCNWRRIVQRYWAVICSPRGEVSMAGIVVGPWGGGGELDPEEATDRKEKYNQALAALTSAGNRAARAVNHWAVWDRSDYALDDLIHGLNALCEHLRLSNSSRMAKRY